MTTTVLDEYILPVLIRYIDEYHWNWNIAMRIINLYHGTEYTQKELRVLYRAKKGAPICRRTEKIC